MRVCVCVHLCVWSHTVHRKYIAMFSASKSASKAYTVFLNVLQKKKIRKEKTRYSVKSTMLFWHVNVFENYWLRIHGQWKKEKGEKSVRGAGKERVWEKPGRHNISGLMEVAYRQLYIVQRAFSWVQILAQILWSYVTLGTSFNLFRR